VSVKDFFQKHKTSVMRKTAAKQAER